MAAEMQNKNRMMVFKNKGKDQDVSFANFTFSTSFPRYFFLNPFKGAPEFTRQTLPCRVRNTQFSRFVSTQRSCIEYAFRV